MKKKYLLFSALLIGLSPPTKSAVTLDFLKQKMIDYCIPKEGTNCTPSRQANYSENSDTCICGEGTEWVGEDIRACVEPCPVGTYMIMSQSSDDCPSGSYAVALTTDGDACPSGSYQNEINY